MRHFRTVLSALLLTGLWACSSSSYIKTDDAVRVKIDTTDIVLQVISPKIIRVSAGMHDFVPLDTSLMVVKRDKKFTDWTLAEDNDNLVIKTSELIACVDTKTGKICFKDQMGNILLQEKIGGGKTIQKTTTEGADYYKIKQVFESPDDEAFYGLGAQHEGYVNYKGKDVELAQHNLVSCVPFLYSNKNYGILWDNYSISKFGDSRDYQDITSLKLYDKDGKEGGLSKIVTVGKKLISDTISNLIDYQFEEEPGQLSISKEVDENGIMTWVGYIGSDIEGKHKFLMYCSNYTKLWVNDSLIYDVWRQNWNPWFRPFEIDIKKGEKYKIKLEWIVGGGYLALKHLDPLPGNEQMQLTLSSEAGRSIDYYFVKGKNADEVISGYRTLTGKATMVPKWAMGFWQSRERYKTQDELLDVVKTFRKKQIPLDNIVLDWNYWPTDKWGSHEFDSTRFPSPAKMVKELHDMHTNIMISIWCKYYEGIDNYNKMKEKGYLFMNNIEKGRLDWIWPGYKNTFYDVYNPGARNMFWDQIKSSIYDKGFDAWWLDATEPDMHSNISIKERKNNMTPNYFGNGEEFFNPYSLLNAKGVYESQRSVDPNKRVFILTRSAYAGQQRYAGANWSGDIVSRWSDLKEQVSVGINYSISGLPYWTMDIGGFAIEGKYWDAKGEVLDEWRELQTRWYQLGAFCPLFRVHGQYPFREVFNIAPENHPAYKSMVYYNKLRYKLMPYIYTLAADAYHKDYTIMRALVMDFNDDSKVSNIDDQFMFGPSLMINPVHKYKATSRQVYLPASCNWYDFYTGESIKGGQTITAAAPYERIPIYVKEGSIIATGVDMQYTNQYPDSLITLYVYAGSDASTEIYSDASTTYDYEKGQYAYVPVTYNDASGELTIGERKGSFPGMVENQTYKVIFIQPNRNISFGDDSKAITIEYTGSIVQVKFK